MEGYQVTLEIAVRTSLKTRLVLQPLRSQTILEIKGVIKYLHIQSFPEHGEISITKLKVHSRDGKFEAENSDVIGNIFTEGNGKISIRVAKGESHRNGPQVHQPMLLQSTSHNTLARLSTEINNSPNARVTSTLPNTSLNTILHNVSRKSRAPLPVARVKLSKFEMTLIFGNIRKSGDRAQEVRAFWKFWDTCKQRRLRMAQGALRSFRVQISRH